MTQPRVIPNSGRGFEALPTRADIDDVVGADFGRLEGAAFGDEGFGRYCPTGVRRVDAPREGTGDGAARRGDFGS